MGRKTRGTRLYHLVAEKLATAIVAGEYRIGERLPGERDLAAAHKVSRATIREAIVALQNDGVLEARMGSGVYVAAVPTTRAVPLPMDVDPFELTEARILFEGEVAALAATQITEAELAELERLLGEMATANKRGHGEAVDRQFHQAIADATRNKAMASVVESLWTIRLESPKCIELFQRSRASGMKPVVGEHSAILDALRSHDAGAARSAMQAHLRQVMNYLLDASETEALTAAKAHASAQRSRFGTAAALVRS